MLLQHCEKVSCPRDAIGFLIDVNYKPHKNHLHIVSPTHNCTLTMQPKLTSDTLKAAKDKESLQEFQNGRIMVCVDGGRKKH